MMGRITAVAVLAVVAVAAAPPATDPDDLLRQGHAAFARGDWEAAVEMYDEAALRATDPGPANFYLATAKYRLATSSSAPADALGDAEALYRACASVTGPHRLEALCGLGNCLVLRGPTDARMLKDAVRCYDICCRDGDAALQADAAYNRERARLLLRQVPPPQEPVPEETPRNDTTPQTSQRPGDSEDKRPSELGGDERPGGMAKEPREAKAGAERTPAEQPTPGAGNLPSVPDRPDLPPLTAREAAAHLEAAHQRIVAERKKHFPPFNPSNLQNVPGW